MNTEQLLNKLDKELAYVNASREAHFHIQSIIDENRRLIFETSKQMLEREQMHEREKPE